MKSTKFVVEFYAHQHGPGTVSAVRAVSRYQALAFAVVQMGLTADDIRQYQRIVVREA